MTPRIVHIIGRYLGRSETFIYDLITNVAGFEHHVLTTRTENLDVFPYDRLIVASAEDEYAGHVARLQASALVCHFGPSGLTGIIPGLVCNVPVITVFHGYDASMLLRDPAWVERIAQLLLQVGESNARIMVVTGETQLPQVWRSNGRVLVQDPAKLSSSARRLATST